MNRRASFAPLLVLVSLACSSSPSVQSCAADSDCGGGNVCQLGSCAGNAPPSASFSAPAAATTNRLVSLTPTWSDPEGRAVELRWSLAAVAGGCDPEPEPREGPGLDVVFWCPGTYEATLVPVDDLGAEGAPVSHAFAVTEAVGAPTVTVGPAIPARHLCDPDVPACTVLSPDGFPTLNLRATGTDPGGAPLVYEWTALPPAAVAADPALVVDFAPGRFDDAPAATIGNSGGPIAGSFHFRVRVRSPQGLLAQAFQEVVVGNHAPVVSPAALVLGHRYADGVYLAEGDIDTGASDPDGDPLFAAGVLDPAPPAGCTEEVTPASGGRVHVRIACSVATALIGERARSLSVAIADSNGARVAITAPIEIANGPPSITLGPAFTTGILAVDHRVEPCALAAGVACFVAAGGDPFVVVDPEGDPIAGYQLGATVASDRSASKGTATVEGTSYRFRFETPTHLPLQFRSAEGASGFTLSASAVDSFGAAGSVALPLSIRNRSPIVKDPLPANSVPHEYRAASRRYLASATGALFEDPDGDPLLPTVPANGFCRSVTLEEGRAVIGCEHAWDYTLGGVPPLSGLLAPRSVSVTTSDGWASAASPTVVTILDRPATVSAPITVVENCGCISDTPCWVFAASGMGLPIPVELADPDGDPSQLTVNLTGLFTELPQPLPVVCVPGWCYPTANSSSSSARGTIATKSGASTGTSYLPFSVSASCSSANLCCR